MLDLEDEDFICRSVEPTATAHGRRHDSVLYLGHRVKKKHLTLANFNLRNRDKRLIRSSTTVYNRSRPRNKRSAEAKRHLGKWLFCTHTPPKTEESAVETTHHQRSHVKNCTFSIFHREKNDGLVISMDDKAYLRPGTDVGARTVRRKRIFVSDKSKQKRLPVHDFNVPEINVTPSVFRVMRDQVSSVSDCWTLIRDKIKALF